MQNRLCRKLDKLTRDMDDLRSEKEAEIAKARKLEESNARIIGEVNEQLRSTEENVSALQARNATLIRRIEELESIRDDEEAPRVMNTLHSFLPSD